MRAVNLQSMESSKKKVVIQTLGTVLATIGISGLVGALVIEHKSGKNVDVFTLSNTSAIDPSPEATVIHSVKHIRQSVGPIELSQSMNPLGLILGVNRKGIRLSTSTSTSLNYNINIVSSGGNAVYSQDGQIQDTNKANSNTSGAMPIFTPVYSSIDHKVGNFTVPKADKYEILVALKDTGILIARSRILN